MATSQYHPDTMRARFAEATAEREAIAAKAQPLREARDAFSNEADAKLRAMNTEIRRIEAPLYDLDNERGALARALNGKTAVVPESLEDS